MKDDFVNRLKSGDESAFEEFYKEHYKALFNFVYRKIKKKEVVDEIVNKTFFNFFEALRDFQGRSSLKTFLFSIARHKVIDYYRRKKIKKVLLSKIPEQVIAGVKFVIDEEIEREELKTKIKRAFDLLPKEYRRILRLKYIEGLKVKEIAELFKLRFKATESMLFRARKAFIKVFNNL